jgi:PAS domain-containing protein
MECDFGRRKGEARPAQGTAFGATKLGILVDRFNQFLAGIESVFGEVEKERARFHFMAESMPQKIFTARTDGEIDYFNQAVDEFTGLSFE